MADSIRDILEGQGLGADRDRWQRRLQDVTACDVEAALASRPGSYSLHKLAALVSPALTTVHIPKYDLGNQAMRLLLTMMEPETDQLGERVLPAPVALAPHLVVRESTAEVGG